MKIIKIFSVIFLLFYFVINLHAQSTTQPPVLSGSSSIIFDGSTYTFNAVGVTYKYSLQIGMSDQDFQKGTLCALTVIKNGITFTPSNYGDVKTEINGMMRKPWIFDTNNPEYLASHPPHLIHSLVLNSPAIVNSYPGNTEVTVMWKIWQLSDYCYVTYRFSISGQTLVIKITDDFSSGKIAGLGFSNASFPASTTAKVINIPYLPIMNVLYLKPQNGNGFFTTLFADWESTNSSGIMPWISDNPSQGYYSQRIEYEKLTNGNRNQFNETVYLSVSDSINRVIPNIVGSPAPNRNTMWNKIVISYFKPFPYLLNDAVQTGTSVGYIDDLYLNFGVRDAAFIIKNWGNEQFDQSYPTTWPPDEFTVDKHYGTFPSGVAGISGLKQVIDDIKSRNNFIFALHENYTDYYPAPGLYSSGKLPNGNSALAFLHIYDQNVVPAVQSNFLKPSNISSGVASTEIGKIKTGLTSASTSTPDFSYLDVSTAINPSGPIVTSAIYHSIDAEAPLSTDRPWSYVDFDASLGNDAGKFRYTMTKYRELANSVRSSYNNKPVEGEGGYHFLYAGYFDDFEGRLQTGGTLEAYNAPVILEFSKKIREKSAVHGVGHIQWFFKSLNGGNDKNILSNHEIRIYMATELAYGHASLVTTAPGFTPANPLLNKLIDRDHAQWAQQYLRWVQQLYANAQPTNITYFDGAGSYGNITWYLNNHISDFDNINSSNFMGRMKIEYSNGLVIFVNRRNSNWTISPSVFTGGSGYYCYNILNSSNIETLESAWTAPASPINLPAESGWLCYSPTVYPTFSKTMNEIPIFNEEIPIVFELSQNYPNPFNPETTISYSIPENSFVILKVYDVLGREIVTLINDFKEKGNYKMLFDGSKLSSGVYFYKLTAGSNNSIKKMLLIK